MNNQLPPINFIVQNGIHVNQVFTIQGAVQIIGRGSGSHIIITDKSLSRRHAQIKTTPHGYVIEDLGSTNGTYINEKQVTGSAPLRPGDTIRLGTTVTVRIQLQPGTMDNTDDQGTQVLGGTPASDGVFDPTVVPGGRDHTMIPDRTVDPRGVPPRVDHTYIPPTPLAQPQPQRQGIGITPWLWVMAAVIVVLLIIAAALIFLRFSTLSQASPTEIAQPPTPSLMPMPNPTSSPTDTPIPTATPSSSPTVEQIEVVVAGVPATMAEEGQVLADISTKVDPFCNDNLELKADEPVLISWVRLVAADDEANYQNQWLEATYYDIRLDGRPITELGPLNYYRDEFCNKNGLCGPAFNWWINAGLLAAGSHYLSIEWYTNRAISNGLDVEPADGQVDSFGPGLAGKGFCNLVVVEAAPPTSKESTTDEDTSSNNPSENQSALISGGVTPIGSLWTGLRGGGVCSL